MKLSKLKPRRISSEILEQETRRCSLPLYILTSKDYIRTCKRIRGITNGEILFIKDYAPKVTGIHIADSHIWVDKKLSNWKKVVTLQHEIGHHYYDHHLPNYRWLSKIYREYYAFKYMLEKYLYLLRDDPRLLSNIIYDIHFVSRGFCSVSKSKKRKKQYPFHVKACKKLKKIKLWKKCLKLVKKEL